MKDAPESWAIVVSIVALALSGMATWLTLRHSSRSQRLATFERIHEALIDPKAAGGRKLLYQAAKSGNFPVLGDEDWDQVNYALALYDTLGSYLSLRLVDRDVVTAAWYHPVIDIAGPVEQFLAHRRSLGINQPWTYLLDLISLMRQTTCPCRVCRESRRG
ncbi:MAG: hypothetical protein V9G19_21660 [Tetrasphaera sp.]